MYKRIFGHLRKFAHFGWKGVGIEDKRITYNA